MLQLINAKYRYVKTHEFQNNYFLLTIDKIFYDYYPPRYCSLQYGAMTYNIKDAVMTMRFFGFPADKRKGFPRKYCFRNGRAVRGARGRFRGAVPAGLAGGVLCGSPGLRQ